MARNQEKGNTLFSKWTDFKANSSSKSGRTISSEITSIPEAEKIRRETVHEITKKITAIANASLGEYRIKEINDEINKLMKKKYFWESRIVELGGTDHRRTRQNYDIDGKELPGAPGYRYYGAAKDLPGVRELFQEKDGEIAARRQKRTKGDMYKDITPEYYGCTDEDDAILVPKESAREKELIAIAEKEWAEKKRRLEAEVKRSGGVFGRAELLLMEPSEEDIDSLVNAANAAYNAVINGDVRAAASSTVYIPTQNEIQEQLLESKKVSLLSKFL